MVASLRPPVPGPDEAVEPVQVERPVVLVARDGLPAQGDREDAVRVPEALERPVLGGVVHHLDPLVVVRVRLPRHVAIPDDGFGLGARPLPLYRHHVLADHVAYFM